MLGKIAEYYIRCDKCKKQMTDMYLTPSMALREAKNFAGWKATENGSFICVCDECLKEDRNEEQIKELIK